MMLFPHDGGDNGQGARASQMKAEERALSWLEGGPRAGRRHGSMLEAATLPRADVTS